MNKGDFITACSNIFNQYGGTERFDQLCELWDEIARQNKGSAEQQPITKQGSTLPQISALQQEIYGILPADRMYSREELLSYVKRAETL